MGWIFIIFFFIVLLIVLIASIGLGLIAAIGLGLVVSAGLGLVILVILIIERRYNPIHPGSLWLGTTIAYLVCAADFHFLVSKGNWNALSIGGIIIFIMLVVLTLKTFIDGGVLFPEKLDLEEALSEVESAASDKFIFSLHFLFALSVVTVAFFSHELFNPLSDWRKVLYSFVGLATFVSFAYSVFSKHVQDQIKKRDMAWARELKRR